MDSIKITKVNGVVCRKPGQTSSGVLHLTAHHLIFEDERKDVDEMWVPYPLISLVTRMPLSLEGTSALQFHLRTFTSFSLVFTQNQEALDVFDSVRGLTVNSSVQQLYAFFYTPSPPLENGNGWKHFLPREEFARMGVGSRTKAWRFTDINKDYSFCPTYPAKLVVPTRISDTTLQYASKYRSKCRIPSLVYLHWANYGTITRSSQPMVGLTNNRSIQDEKLIEAIFQSHISPESKVSTTPIYGATSTNLIIDARPTTNAMANVAKGAGSENMEYYKEGKKAYLGIDNIHVMRDSLNKVVQALREADAMAYGIGGNDSDSSRLASLSSALLDRQALRRSGWLRHLSAILDGTLLIVRNIHVNSSHVLIHCSDGWDRTAQLSSLAQLCLDPYYRTYKGFQILVEKDWVSFGHRFLDRCGHLSSEKFFISAPESSSGNSGADAAQAIFASVQNRIAGQGHLKETSPVFHQFLECVRQIQRQFPERFEFNGRYLQTIYHHLYSCQFGTFLFNNEHDLKVGDNGPPPCERTISFWDFLNNKTEVEQNTNTTYDSSLDNPSRRDPKSNMGVLFPDPKDVRFWNELYGRTDEEMNGKQVISEALGADVVGPITSADDDPVLPLSSAANSEEILPTNNPTPLDQSLSLNPASSLSQSSSSSISPLNNSSTSLADSKSVSQRPAPYREDSFRPFASSSSAFSLRPNEPPRGNPNYDTDRNRFTAIQSDIFPSGMKSMWGKLSSNATAAFSVVQGAYGDISKEFKNMSFAQGRENEGMGRELENPGRPPALQDEADWTSNSGTSGLGSSNTPTWTTDTSVSSSRWRSEGNKTRASTLSLENPWSTSSRTDGQPHEKRADELFSTSSVWADEGSKSSTNQPLKASVSATDLAENSRQSRISANENGLDPLGVL